MTEQLDRLKAALADRYVLERQLGQGGMATVYLARDLRHERQVAVKVLRPDLAAALGPDRFLREIRIAANLTHPHILPLHDSGEADGFLYYVMPYIEGSTLRERIARETELPVPEAVRIVREVADALAFAHGKGVVHRDIKPDNVMLSGGHAIVTDFGVAKAVSDATGRDKLTTAGVALGTPAYMAPEQATASPHIDHRADIYAVGAMAYELLTGRPPFTGATPQSVLAAHVTEEAVPVAKYRNQVSPELEAVIMRCLAKRPADRWQSAGELLPYLDAAATPSGGLTPTGTLPLTAASKPVRRWLVPAVAVVAVAAIAVAAMVLLQPKPLTITVANVVQVTREPAVEYQPAISPDGREVAFVEFSTGRARIVVKGAGELESGVVRPTSAVEGFHWYPSWSDDEQRIRFWVESPGDTGWTREWRDVGRLGGPARRIGTDIPWRAAWSRDGSRIAFARGRDSLFVAPAGGGASDLLATHAEWTSSVHSPVWSPDGSAIALVHRNPDWKWSGNIAHSSIWIVSTPSGRVERVTDEEDLNTSPQWLDDDHLVFVSDRDGPWAAYVVAVGNAGARGEPQVVPGIGDPHWLSVSADGRRIAWAKFDLRQNIFRVPIPKSGTASIADAEAVTSGSRIIEEHDISPDLRWIAFDMRVGSSMDIFRMPLDGGPIELVADLPETAFHPRWSPDGTELAFDGDELWIVPAGGGPGTRLTDNPGRFDDFPEWSRDGLTIAYIAQGPDGSLRTWIVSRDRVGAPWGTPRQITDYACIPVDWSLDGNALLCWGSELLELQEVMLNGDVRARFEARTMGLDWMSSGRYATDGSKIYFLGGRSAEPEGALWGVWSIPVGGGIPNMVVEFPNDPAFDVKGGITVTSTHIYLTLVHFESDIHVADLEW